MKRFLLHFLRDERGVSALEYAVLAGMILLGVVAGINGTGLKTSISSIFTQVNSALTSAAN